jgi:hypothetical protein
MDFTGLTATATSPGTAGGSGVPAPLAPAAPVPAAPAGGAAGAAGGSGPAGPDAHSGASPQAVTTFLLLIIPAGLLLAMARRQVALPALLDPRGPHRPG